MVTPTLDRPEEVDGLLRELASQTVLPSEVIVVDAAASEVDATRRVVEALRPELPFPVSYLRHARGTATQRNRGIEAASGELIAFLDDDVRPRGDYLERMRKVFDADSAGEVGGVVGYRTNQHFRLEQRRRWRWYRRLRLLSTFEPGRYDRRVGIPINANLQPQFSGTREVDFATTACAVWRREVFDRGLRFDEFFTDFGVLEDAHLSLRASREWRLLQCGDARAVELSSPRARVSRRAIGYKAVVNYYFVFDDVCGPLRMAQRTRFWLFQSFELVRIAAAAVFGLRRDCVEELAGRLSGIWAVTAASLRGRSLRTLRTT